MKNMGMKRKLLFGFLILALTAVPLFAACGEDEGPTDWGEPEYGGTLTMRVDEFFSLQFDPYGPPVFSGQWQLWFETLFSTDWTLDRNIWPFNTSVIPAEYVVGHLAESWEQPDAQTIIVHLREGVHWQDKPPVNGRELVADDVVHHYNRLCGTGDGFTAPSLFWSYFTDLVESITAIDRYTVEFKFKQANLINFFRLVDTFQYNNITAPEWVELGGPPPPAPPPGEPPPPPPPPGAPVEVTPLTDWRNAVGTGPFILEEYVEGSALNFVKNENYWGYDERFPENKLPYFNEVVVVCIPDNATAISALRSGQIDILSGITWQQAQSIAETNPELEQIEMPQPGCDVLFNLNKSPFTDIKVRKALQLAIDRELIAESHYGEIVDGTPCGQIHPSLEEYCFAYEDWPQELKDEYSYNVEEAIDLLADAGLAGGFDTKIEVATTYDLDLIEIIQNMFREVGVNMEIVTYDMATVTDLIMTGRHEQMTWAEAECGSINWPFQSLLSMTSYFTNPSTVNDPVYDDMCRSLETITDQAAFAQAIRDADRYALEQHWKVRLFPIYKYTIWQPYLKGYSGELFSGFGGGNMAYFARWWKGTAE
jgi:peptide/nickel transport system substrate-binding protein